MKYLTSSLLILILVALAAVQPGLAAPDRAAGDAEREQEAPLDNGPTPYAPSIAPASDEADLAMRSVDAPPGIQVTVAAAEPQVANPVAFCFDRSGRVYVAETYRQDGLRGVEDNRAHMDWLNDDLAARTVDDRRAYLERHLGDEIARMTEHHDRVRQLRDTDGDGKYETATVFADGFNDVLDGTGAGLLEVGGDLWYTCIPNLWRLRDTDDDGVADKREVLHRGFGVRFAFRGHDLHGLIRGPDGRIYFSVGDRGYHVVTEDGVLADPESGAVFRCEMDGSNLEVFATGLRNPQELAFNKYGDLFTGDNNSDSGDRARWVHLVQGSDSGWRMAYQYLSDRGPFNREKIWHPYHQGQPAYIVPPIANVGDGPSGLVYYPGTGLTDEFDDTFFLCDFRGTPAKSGIRAIRQEPNGATYKLNSAEPFIWQVLATDCEFGPDGAFYILDWVSGWTGVGKGRIYRATPTDPATPVAIEARNLLGGEIAAKQPEEWVKLLNHPNMRVRLGAQYELAEHGQLRHLEGVAKGPGSRLARIHAIWGLGQSVRRRSAIEEASAAGILVPLLHDPDDEIRVQVIRVLSEFRRLGDEFQRTFREHLHELAAADSARIRAAAALALARFGNHSSLGRLLAVLADNNKDPVLRHCAVMGLAGSQSPETLLAAAKGASPPERLGIVLALRRIRSPLAANFLSDNQAQVAEEAARAIYDVPIDEAMEALARTLDARHVVSEPFMRRAMAANYRLGGSESARRIARAAAHRHASPAVRMEALQMILQWAEPSPRDWILGMWRPIDRRSPQEAAKPLELALPTIMADRRDVRARALFVAGRLGIASVTESLMELLGDANYPVSDRSDALAGLGGLGKDVQLRGVDVALSANEPDLRARAIKLLPELAPRTAFAPLKAALDGGTAIEQQAALAGLGELNDGRADVLLLEWLERLSKGEVEPAVRLDVLEAAAEREVEPVKDALALVEGQLADREPLDAFAFALEGGDAEAGREVFYNKASVSCARCHSIESDVNRVGPNLAGIANKKSRRELLEAIILPNKTIAEGFATVVLVLDTGKTVSGIVRQEVDGVIHLVDDQSEEFTFGADSIEDRYQGQSAMPDDVAQHLTRREIRDLVEFLASLKD